MSWINKLKRLWRRDQVEPHPAGGKSPRIEPRIVHKAPHEKIESKKPVLSSNEGVVPGWKTQFDSVDENAVVNQVIIGLDFGTAYTKVVVGRGDEKYGVPINSGATGSEGYLLPTQICIDSNGGYFADLVPGKATCYRDLKMQILQGKLDEEARNRIIAYLAIVFQRTRAWFLTEKKAVYGDSQLKWEVNVGLPTETYNAEKLQKIYKGLVGDAWFISTGKSALTVRRVKQEKNVPENSERGMHPDRIAAFPEFVAQITGYISSQRRRPGVHTLVDVGAGTVDVTVFNVHMHEGEHRHPIFAQSVKSLGTNFLVEHRCGDDEQCRKRLINPGTPVPSDEVFRKMLGISSRGLDQKDRPFRQKVYDQTNSQVRYTREKMAPLQLEWERGVPLMMCGGGSRVNFYKSVVSSLTESGRGYNLKEFALPSPENLDAPGLLDLDSDRLSVAYGLSAEAFDMGEITYPKIFEEIVPGGVSHTHTCPKCGGTGGGYGTCVSCGGSGFI